MSASEKSSEIVNNFCKYVKTGNKKLIENYSLEELKQAKYQYAQDSYREFYIAIVDRIKEAEDIENNRRTAKERRKNKLIGAVLGLISGVILTLISILLTNLLTRKPK